MQMMQPISVVKMIRIVKKVLMMMNSETIRISTCFTRQEEIIRMLCIFQIVMILSFIILRRTDFSKHSDSFNAIVRGSNMWPPEGKDKNLIE